MKGWAWVMLGVVASGCALPASVLKGDEALARGEAKEAQRLYREGLNSRMLTPSAYDATVERLERAAEAQLRQELESRGERLRQGPPLEVLAELSQMRADQARQVGLVQLDGLLLEAMVPVAERGWATDVEPARSRGHHESAVGRAQSLAAFFPNGHPFQERVERLRQEAAAQVRQQAGVDASAPALPPLQTRLLEQAREAGAAGQPERAKRMMLFAAALSPEPTDAFLAEASARRGVHLPELRALPPPPPVPDSVRSAAHQTRNFLRIDSLDSRLRQQGLGSVGITSVNVTASLLALQATELPAQSDRLAGLFSTRMAVPLLAQFMKTGREWALADELLVEMQMGARLSQAYVYPRTSPTSPEKMEGGLALGGRLGYALMGGYRTTRLGALAGLGAQRVGLRIADVTAAGGVLPLMAQFELSLRESYPLILQGWMTPWAAGNASRGLILQFQFMQTLGLSGRYEELELRSRMGGLSGDDRIDAGRRGWRMMSLGLTLRN